MKRNPKVFVGSTVEGLDYTRALIANLEHEEFDLVPWTRYFEDPLESTLSQLFEAKSFDFAVLIFTPDDKIESRNSIYDSPRDNLVFELGLFLGFLGSDRVFPLIPRKPKLKLPSDLLGTNPFRFEYGKYGTLSEFQQALEPAAIRILDKMKRMGYRSRIVFHPSVVFREKRQRLSFKIANIGLSPLMNVRLSAHLLSVYKSKQGGYYRNWATLKLSTRTINRLQLSWTFSHKIDKGSPISKAGDFDTADIASLNQIKMKQIILEASGTEANTNLPHFSEYVYEFTDVEEGQFKRFYQMDENGIIIMDSVNWGDFGKIIVA